MPLKMWHASKIAIQWENYDKPLIFGRPIFKQVGYDSRIPNLILRVVPPMKKMLNPLNYIGYYLP